jgi:hypothetical protein
MSLIAAGCWVHLTYTSNQQLYATSFLRCACHERASDRSAYMCVRVFPSAICGAAYCMALPALSGASFCRDTPSELSTVCLQSSDVHGLHALRIAGHCDTSCHVCMGDKHGLASLQRLSVLISCQWPIGQLGCSKPRAQQWILCCPGCGRLRQRSCGGLHWHAVTEATGCGVHV